MGEAQRSQVDLLDTGLLQAVLEDTVEWPDGEAYMESRGAWQRCLNSLGTPPVNRACVWDAEARHPELIRCLWQLPDVGMCDSIVDC